MTKVMKPLFLHPFPSFLNYPHKLSNNAIQSSPQLQSPSHPDIRLTMPLFLRNLFLDHLYPIIILHLQIIALSACHRPQLPFNVPIIRVGIEVQSSDIRDDLLEFQR